MAYVTGSALDLSTPRFYSLDSSNWGLAGGGGIGGILYPSDIYWLQASGTLLNIDQEGVPAGTINLNVPVSAFTEWNITGTTLLLSVQNISVPLSVTKYGTFSSGFSAQLNIAWPTILAGNDSIIGSGRLFGYGGDDHLRGQLTNDTLDGGAGFDTAEFKLARGDYQIMVAPDQRAAFWSSYLFHYHDGDGLDVLSNVEVAQFSDGKISYPFLGTVQALEYVASYSDLMAAFVTNAQAGFDHFVGHGYLEGRTTSFDGLEYIASYSDLMNAFGTNQDAGTSHFITNGRFEGRTTSFDGLEYIASYSDLMNAFGTNQDAGTSHFITNGHGRPDHQFDGLQYIASYGDLIQAFGANSDAGSTHYIAYGRFEGRAQDTFNAAQYLDNYADLQAAFGSDLEAATLHYIQYGYFEGRNDDII